MMAEVLFQEHGIGPVIFGAADTEGFPITAEHSRIDGEKDNEVVGPKGGNDRAAGGLDGNGNRLIGESSPDFGDPFMEGFGCLVDHQVLRLAARGSLNPEIVLFVGPVQADRGREGRVNMCAVHF